MPAGQRPLCPAGHLPHTGGDRPSFRLSPTANVAGVSCALKLPISPQVGEMPGRAEGGAKECYESIGIPVSRT
ncbi:hypothetical protein EN885_22855 [Mesorhizobium sp. M6A.T.Cr.TU.014.01.1.1]|nr:hypothetical protein EOB36_25360 [Mesorhizobium sp. M6A.T.Cr.TU.017.01.1.1]RVB74467.1 hypothetical protein EN885_22855 [Mesorhizobium sp. M6A.T.Cr.TU.014.01.1.1]RWP74964.1 MAG: hypothetical protein EOR09_14495 [Mesorhizobium sp.]RWP75096.1 MAG: hypothetical protein EOR10_21045 [Mesorhizobium sp.]RWQ04959.1 MAG: hypothetical protein EOR91_17100 [Mesorhizobium sp.]